MNKILEQFKKDGYQASYHFACDHGTEYQLGYKYQKAAIKAFKDHPELKDEMIEIAKGFLWSIKSYI
jgi:hypothetical protein